jgi:hypothetical protein
MNPLLIYFKEDCIELWSLDNNGRLIPVLYHSSNKLPLYFLLSGDEILMDDFAKQSYFSNSPNSYGDFWHNLSNESINYERFLASNSFATLLPYVFKESVLPSIAKSHFQSNLPTILNQSNVGILFDSFVEDDHREIILNLFFQIVGFDPNSLISIDFFDCFRDLIIKKNLINQTDSFLIINISEGNFYFHLIGRNCPSHLGKKVLEGKGQDPVLDIVLDFLVEIAHAKGSIINSIELKKELKNDAIAILGKISGGLVLHTIKNSNLDVSPLKISFHKNDIEGRINNRQSLNFIQHELDSFIKQNNATLLPIFLSGNVINEVVFREFFTSIYSKVNFEKDQFNHELLLHCLNKMLANEFSSPHGSVEIQEPINPKQKDVLVLNNQQHTEDHVVINPTGIPRIPQLKSPPLPPRVSVPSIPPRPSFPPRPSVPPSPSISSHNFTHGAIDKPQATPKQIFLNTETKATNKSVINAPPPVIKPELKLPPGIKTIPPIIPTPKSIVPPPPPPLPIKKK